MIDAQTAMREAGQDKEAPALVPTSWELIQYTADGQETVMAKGVVSFDLHTDGSLIYTNGSAVYHLDAHGKSTRLLKNHLIEDVMLLNEPVWLQHES